MVDADLLEALEHLTQGEQKAILSIAEYLKNHRQSGSLEAEVFASALSEEMSELRFAEPDESLSPARVAARRFMRENPVLMRLLAQ